MNVHSIKTTRYRHGHGTVRPCIELLNSIHIVSLCWLTEQNFINCVTNLTRFAIHLIVGMETNFVNCFVRLEDDVNPFGVVTFDANLKRKTRSAVLTNQEAGL